MTDLAKLVVSKNMGGSSGRGISYYMNIAGCERRAYLDEKLRLNHAALLGPDGAAPVEANDSGASIGTIFHAMMELYYGTQDSEYVIEIDDMDCQPDLLEAQRLFTAYRSRFPSNEWNVVGVEVDLPARGDTNQAFRLMQQLGFEFTARLDAVVEITEEHIAAGLLIRRPGLNGIVPGRYIIDHKTMSARRNDAPLFYRQSPQFIMYPWLWNFLNPELKVLGMISNNIVRHQKLVENSFFSTLVDIDVSIHESQGVIEWLRRTSFVAEKLQSGQSEGRPNLAACDGKYRLCRHLLNGMCNRV